MKNVAFLLISVCFLAGCKSTYQIQKFQSSNTPAAPNYEEAQNWAVLPHTYSDDLKAFSAEDITGLKADVFYVYPHVKYCR